MRRAHRDLRASFQARRWTCSWRRPSARSIAPARAALNLGGGVAANGAWRAAHGGLRGAFRDARACRRPRLCADNAAMIALVGAWQHRRNRHPPDLDAPRRSKIGYRPRS